MRGPRIEEKRQGGKREFLNMGNRITIWTKRPALEQGASSNELSSMSHVLIWAVFSLPSEPLKPPSPAIGYGQLPVSIH